MNNKNIIIALSVVVLIAVVGGVVYYVTSSKQPAPNVQSINQEVANPELNANTNQPPVNTNQALPEPIKMPGKLYLSASKTDLKVGETVTVKVLMDTLGANIVVGRARISYDTNLLELTKLDTTKTAFNFSIVEKKSAGEVDVARGKPGDSDYQDKDDGFTGTDGLLATLTFKAKAAGSAELVFNPKDSTLVLDDGKGDAMVMEYGELTLVVK